MVAAELIYFIFLLYYMVVQVRGEGSVGRDGRTHQLAFLLPKVGPEAGEKRFVCLFLPQRLDWQISVGSESQSSLLQEGPGLVL